MPQPNREFRDILVRSKEDVADAPEWEWIDNNSWTTTVGGTATAGDYVITINPVRQDLASIPITFPRVAEANAAITTGIEDATNVLLAVPRGDIHDQGVLIHYVKSVSVASLVLTYIAQPDAQPFTVDLTAPAPGTLANNLDETFPITWKTLGFAQVHGYRTHLEFTVIPVDSAGVPLDPNGATLVIDIRRMIDSTPGYTDRTSITRVANSAIGTAYNIGEAYRIPGNGGRYSFGSSVMTGTITGLDRFEIWGREVNE